MASVVTDGRGSGRAVASVTTPHNGNRGCGINGTGTCTNDGDLATIFIDADGQEQLVRTIGADTSGGPNGFTRQVLTDLDGDGSLERIASVDHGARYYRGLSALRVYSLDGLELADVSVGQDHPTNFVVGNLDGVGAKEIAANGTGGILQIYDSDLVLTAQTSASTGYLMLAADLDGDGIAELVTRDGQRVRIFDAQSLVEKWTLDVGETVNWAITSDLDADGYAELYIASGGKMTAFSFETEAQTYSIQTTASPAEGGTLSCDPSPVEEGASSTCTASANDGYRFSAWSGDCSGTNPSCTLSNVTAARAVTARFSENPEPPPIGIDTLATPLDGGRVSCDPNPVLFGGSSTCIATAHRGFQFDAWSGDCSGTDRNCTLSDITATRSVTAGFSAIIDGKHPISTTASPAAGGRISCDPNPVPDNRNSTCTATPNEGYSFTGWSGDCDGNNPSCTLSNVSVPQRVFATFSEAGITTEQSARNYVPGDTLTITGFFNDTSGATMRSLVWSPEVPSGWSITSVSGDGAPQLNGNDILFTGRLNPPIAFSYEVQVPSTARGEYRVTSVISYQSDAMINPVTLIGEPDPLWLNPIGRHSADYQDDAWVIDAIEASRVLSYWRAGGYQVNPAGADGYAMDAGSTEGNLHSADYRDPRWRIDSGEANRVLAYWRLGGYQADPAGDDGYAPLGQGARSARNTPVATQQAGPYSAGSNLQISNRIGAEGDANLVSLLWRPTLPSGWTITTVSGDGSPELSQDGTEILFTAGELPLPLNFSYTVAVPASASGPQEISTEYEYWQSGMANPVEGTAQPDPLSLSDGPITGASVGIGLYNPARSIFYLRNTPTAGAADATFIYGPGGRGWQPLIGDWNGDGQETIGLYNPARSMFYLRNANSNGIADATFIYGPGGRGWQPLVGDWDGDGTDTIGLYNPARSIFYLRNANSNGIADATFIYGPGGRGWMPLVGDWDGDGTDTIGLYNPTRSMFYLRNANSNGIADATFIYGPGGLGWMPLIGDWDSNGQETIGLYNPTAGRYYLRNSNSSGIADLNARYGPTPSSWMPLSGAWAN
ncbi:hypothetical protein U5801_25610 [Lamprobacter modestohalophilus]|uniref:InlB B-repeat-containing protein n=1 Tax=Lamprobacter modestohalophilus TaxID=1064514 RepID=UPI002ADECFC7|nr:hypothetical protein [Lamprobacter modestohalophilus]MEA1053158.1 hypothetical protein [Lamprobacter modestohalophilus]